MRVCRRLSQRDTPAAKVKQAAVQALTIQAYEDALRHLFRPD